MIYLPDDPVYHYCPHFMTSVNGHLTLRAYDTIPTPPTTGSFTINYKDWYIDEHYFANSGTVTYSRFTYTCYPEDTITHNLYYRQDFNDICLIFLTFFFFVIFLPFMLFKRFFRRLK